MPSDGFLGIDSKHLSKVNVGDVKEWPDVVEHNLEQEGWDDGGSEEGKAGNVLDKHHCPDHEEVGKDSQVLWACNSLESVDHEGPGNFTIGGHVIVERGEINVVISLVAPNTEPVVAID